MTDIKAIFADGAVFNNGSPNSVGAAAIWIPSLKKSFTSIYHGITNNQAEYLAVNAAARYAVMHEWESVTIYSDSLLVVNQVNNQWSINSDTLFDLYGEVCNRLAQVRDWKLVHVLGHGKCSNPVLRNGNTKADELAQDALAKAVQP